MFKKSPVGLKEVLVKVTLTLLVLSILASAVAMVPVVKAQGYPHIPTMPPSTATPIPSPTPKPSPVVSPSPTEIPWNFPSYNPTQSPTVKGGFWSPLTIGIVVVALVAFAVPAVFFYTRRGKQKILLDEERPFNSPEFPAASNRSTVSSRYSQSSYQSSYQSQQSSKPTETTRYGQQPSYSYRQQQSNPSVTTRSTQTSSYSRPPPYTKICPHCKRGVRNDQNICPYCDKRLR
jgi:hypothetical protein